MHGVESSHISVACLNTLRTAFVAAVWSARVPLAHSEDVLNLLDGPDGRDPVFVVVWTWFRMIRRYPAYHAGETGRIYRM